MESVRTVADGLRDRIEAIASTADASLTVRELVAGAYAAGALDAAVFVGSEDSRDADALARLREAFAMLRHPSSAKGVAW